MTRVNESLMIAQINSQSIFAKRDRFENYLAKNCMDVVLISETWERMSRMYRLRGYRFLSRPRQDGYGGVGILTKNKIIVEEISLPSFQILEAIAIKTKNLDKNLLLVSVYVTQAENANERENVIKDFRKLFEWLNGKQDVIVGGDMNAHARMWDNGCIRNCTRGNLLVNLIQDSELVILNDGRPTRVANVGTNESAIDVSLMSIGLAMNTNWNVTEENLGGDHLMIEMNMGGIKVHSEKREIMNKKKWIERMNEKLRENLNMEQLEYTIERVNEECIKAVDVKEVKIREWWNREIQYWYDKMRDALRQFNRCICMEKKVVYDRSKAKLKKAIRWAKRRSWREYVSKMTHRNTTRDLWTAFNKVRGQISNERNVVKENREKGNQFLNMLMNVKNEINVVDMLESADEGLNSMTAEFEWEEFVVVLGKSKSTTPGTNRITYRMIEMLSNEAKQNWLAAINRVWMELKMPEKWMECRVVPIPKRDRDTNEATNYRGICMLNVSLKILNGMMKERIERFVNENSLLPSTTFGFRRTYSAVDCVERLVWEVRKDKKKVIIVYLDIERAFDHVVPRKLIQILMNLNWPRKWCDWIFEFMKERRMIVSGRDYRLEGRMNIGLPQGSKLSPTLFNLYTSEIHQINTEDKIVLQFADDFAIIGKGKCVEDAMNKVQEGVNQVMECMKNLNLKVNPNKCAWMGFRTNGRGINIRIGNERIEQVNVYRYLGIWIDRRINFTRHMKELESNCRNRLNVIKRVSQPKWGAHPSVTDILRKALVSSKISYGIAVYGNGANSAFERLMKVENACARVVLGAINSTPLQSLWSEMGDSPLKYKREWITARETVRMQTRGHMLVSEMQEMIQSRTIGKHTYRSQIMQENNDIFSKIKLITKSNKPGNLYVHLKFGDRCKSKMNDDMIGKLFLEVKMRYAAYVAVYTDASIIENRVGVGIYMTAMNVERSFRVNDSISIMNAELIGILEGIKLALNEEIRRIAIFSDSKSSMNLLDSKRGVHDNVYVEKIYECIRSSRCEVVIQWIPSHRQIKGNERADMLAKQGCMNNECRENDVIDARDANRMLEKRIWGKWESEFQQMNLVKGKKYSELCSTPLRYPFYKHLKGDTRMIRTMERIRMNHGNWKECLYKRRLSDSKLCEICMIEEDIEHLLLICSRYNQSRSQFNILQNGRSLTEILKMNEDVYREMYEFIRMNGIIV